jgi:hypothetical protein
LLTLLLERNISGASTSPFLPQLSLFYRSGSGGGLPVAEGKMEGDDSLLLGCIIYLNEKEKLAQTLPSTLLLHV